VRQFTLSHRSVRALAGGLGLTGLFFGALLALLVFNGAAHLRARSLAAENAVLSSEMQRFQERIEGLEETIGQLGEQDNRLRLLAGLDTTSTEIRQVGIGGPGLTTPEAHPLWPVDSAMSKAAFAVDYDLKALERRARLLRESLSEASGTLLAHEDLLRSTPSILPTAGVLTSRFSASRLHPIHHLALPHEGIDISAPYGTPILAAAKGTVIFAGWQAGLGYTVEIDHGYGLVTRYGHASKLLVRRGDPVVRGDPIAQVGSTGISTSPHLHYEVHLDGRAVNPINYVIGNIIP
jgi:murein DD-endopeptidase MepM/ murein hydrolase activator NlpD